MTDTIKMVPVRITAYDDDGNSHRVNVVVPSPFNVTQVKQAASKELGLPVVRVAFN